MSTPEMDPQMLEQMMGQQGNGGPPEEPQPPAPPSTAEALDGAIRETAIAAQAADSPEDAKNYGQASFFLAQALAKYAPPSDPNEMAKVQVDREKIETGAQVDRERMAADAVKAAADREAKAVQERIKVERDEAGQATAYVKGGN